MPSAPSAFPLSPGNDFAVKAKLRKIDPTTGVVSPRTTGPVTAFLATSKGPTATAADPALSVAAQHQGDGVWLIFLPASVLTAALLDPLFTATAPVLIVTTGGGRAYAPVTYEPARAALLA